jgi:hypothetical protein
VRCALCAVRHQAWRLERDGLLADALARDDALRSAQQVALPAASKLASCLCRRWCLTARAAVTTPELRWMRASVLCGAACVRACVRVRV